jgi:hypothetical protein
VRRVPFSRFARPDSFSAVPRALGLVFMFCARTRFRRVPFSCFALLGLVFGGTEGVGSRFHVLRARTRFWRYRGRQVSFSCFARPDSFSAVPRASGPVFIFCVPGLVFGVSLDVGSRFHVLRVQTRFRRYRGRRVPFSRFARPESFSVVPKASGLVFMFCASGLVFGGTEGVGSRFHVLCSRTRSRRYLGRRVHFNVLRPHTRFRRFRGLRVSFSYFARPDSFSPVPRASGPVFMFYAPGLVFVGTKGVGSCFHVFCARTRFWRYRGRRVPFSCFGRLDSFPAVPRASAPVFIFCVLGFVLGGTESVGSRFHVLLSRNHFLRCRVRRVPFSRFARLD